MESKHVIFTSSKFNNLIDSDDETFEDSPETSPSNSTMKVCTNWNGLCDDENINSKSKDQMNTIGNYMKSKIQDQISDTGMKSIIDKFSGQIMSRLFMGGGNMIDIVMSILGEFIEYYFGDIIMYDYLKTLVENDQICDKYIETTKIKRLITIIFEGGDVDEGEILFDEFMNKVVLENLGNVEKATKLISEIVGTNEYNHWVTLFYLKFGNEEAIDGVISKVYYEFGRLIGKQRKCKELINEMYISSNNLLSEEMKEMIDELREIQVECYRMRYKKAKDCAREFIQIFNE